MRCSFGTSCLGCQGDIMKAFILLLLFPFAALAQVTYVYTGAMMTGVHTDNGNPV
jgi:hypothetical protein